MKAKQIKQQSESQQKEPLMIIGKSLLPNVRDLPHVGARKQEQPSVPSEKQPSSSSGSNNPLLGPVYEAEQVFKAVIAQKEKQKALG